MSQKGYGTFLDSLYAERTELTSVGETASSRVDEVGHCLEADLFIM